jgi:hypothetical protein
MLDLKSFQHHLPPIFQTIHGQLRSFQLKPTVVGGIVRDFIIKGRIGSDWDIELSHDSLPFNVQLWKDLGRSLSKLGRVSYLPYNIIRLDAEGVQFEFSPPRKEIFNGRSDHKNFEAEFDLGLPFAEAVKRRDFTINAMGVLIPFSGESIFLDPLDGLKSWHEKMLVPCGDDFAKDPVRFLRALRFSQKLKLELSQDLKLQMNGMDLSALSASYVWNEMQKSGDQLKFLTQLVEAKKTHPELKLPLTILSPDLAAVLKKPSQHESWMVALEWVGSSCEDWQKFFSLGSETCQRIARWSRSTKDFRNLEPEIFHGDFGKILEKPQFQQVFDWYFSTKQLLQKSPELPLLEMIAEYLPSWIHLYRFEAVKDVRHIDPPLRAKYQVWNLCQRL